LIIGLPGLCLSAMAFAEESLDYDAKSIDAVLVEPAPVIDGVLDEEVWKRAQVVEDFHMVDPDEYATASEASRIYVLRTADSLYIGGIFQDREPAKISALTLRQGDWARGEDSLSVVLDPFNQGRGGYIFDLNPNGVRNDALYSSATSQNWQWNGIWNGAGQRTDEGWVAELEIPFKTLSFDPNNDTWGINFTRWIGRRNERIGWVSHNRDQTPATSGKISGMRGARQGVGLDVVPSMRLADFRNYTNGSSDQTFEPSADIFYRITPSLTGALTINTDFSGTEVDARQVNLTRFDVFFPERRAFFLQDSDVFEFGDIGGSDWHSSTFGRADSESGRPYFSRRMGLGTDGEVVDINTGIKIAGRVGRWNLGLMNIEQDRFDSPGTANLLVARAAANVLAESTLGVILTQGDPTSDIDNTVYGIDFRYLNSRTNSGSLTGSAWYQKSNTDGVEGKDAAWGLKLAAPNASGFRWMLGVKELQENFYPALGYTNRVDVRDYTLEAAYTHYLENRYLRSIYSGLEGERVERLDGGLESQVMSWRLLELTNHSNDKLSFHATTNKEVLRESFEIADGIELPTGDYSFTQYCLKLDGGGHRKVSGNTYYCDGDFYSGAQTSAGGSVTYRPSVHFKFQLGADVYDTDLPEGRFITRLASLRADWIFSRKWSWENYIQYDNDSNSIGVNSILRWVPMAGQQALLVLNRDFERRSPESRFHSVGQELVAKISYTFRF
jgi:hypothetical protein